MELFLLAELDLRDPIYLCGEKREAFKCFKALEATEKMHLSQTAAHEAME